MILKKTNFLFLLAIKEEIDINIPKKVIKINSVERKEEEGEEEENG